MPLLPGEAMGVRNVRVRAPNRSQAAGAGRGRLGWLRKAGCRHWANLGYWAALENWRGFTSAMEVQSTAREDAGLVKLGQ